MVDLTVIILTYNEERHIVRAIDSVKGFARRIVVVDSYSSDATVDLARGQGAEVLQNRFVNQARQFNWAMEHAGLDSAWLMRLDADEVIEGDLGAEIARELPALGPEVVGVNLKRKHIFLGRWIRHGGRYPLVLLRIWRTGHGRVEDRWMDEHVVVGAGRIVTFGGGFADHNLNDLSYFTDKHNKYSTREAIEAIGRRRRLFEQRDSGLEHGGSAQARLKRRIKNHVYNKIPYPISATAYFLFRMIFQLGVLDGRAGLVYHGLQGLWYRFLVGAKVAEYEAQLAGIQGKDALLAKLSELTGHRVVDAKE